MTSIATIIGYRWGRKAQGLLPLLLVALLLVGGSAASAQVPQTGGTGNTTLDTIPEEAKAVFYRYVQKKDTAMMEFIEMHRRDKFIKRFSFHTNAVDWATLVPNIGIEFDLKGTPRNNYSVSLFGKFNGKSKHGKLIYNVNAVRVEGRKYWRTGKYGSAGKYYDNFVKLCTDTASLYFNADTLAGISYYVDTLGRVAKDNRVVENVWGVKFESLRDTAGMTQAQKDSLDFSEDSLGIKKSRFRQWYYNTYHKFRRNVTSGRTLENARNWRAYYLGVWAGIDNWSISLTGKGRQGQGVGAGLVAGYTLPLFPQKFPREGSLDLDFGLAAGWKAVKYDAYTYEEQTQHYVYDPARSHPTWKIVPYPIVQDIHVSLVWRFRGIKSKVDMALIDDYNWNWVEKYEKRTTNASNKYMNVQRRRREILDALNKRYGIVADSTGIWDAFHRRRLDAAKRIKPDTVFVGDDQFLYLKIFEGLKTQQSQDAYMKNKQKQAEQAAKVTADSLENVRKDAARKAKIAAKAMADSLEDARKDSARQAKIAAKAMADSLKDVRKDSLKTDSVPVLSDDTIMERPEIPAQAVPGDSIPTLPTDSVPAVPEDTTPVPADSIPAIPEGTLPSQPEDSTPVIVPQTDTPVDNGGEETEEDHTADDGGNGDADAIIGALWRKGDGTAQDGCTCILE